MLLYKAMRAAVARRPDRTEIVLDRDNFPTDRYVADGVARECGLTLRWIDVDTAAGVTADLLAEAVGEQTALVVLSHVAYRSAWLADAPALTADRSRRGCAGALGPLALGGSVPMSLDAWDVDLAVGCTYKYLNGGPGAPAFVYVAERLLDDDEHPLTQPVQGWMGARDPFLWVRRTGRRKAFVASCRERRPWSACSPCRTCSRWSTRAGMDAVREKSVGLTEYAIARGRRAASRADPGLAAGVVPARWPRHVHPPLDARGHG